MADELCKALSRRLTRSSLRVQCRRRRSTLEHPVCVAERLTFNRRPQRIGLGPSSFQLQLLEPDHQVSNHRQHLGPDSIHHPAVILLKAYVPPVMRSVLDCRPIIADQLGYLLLAQDLQRDTDHLVSHLGWAGRLAGLRGDAIALHGNNLPVTHQTNLIKTHDDACRKIAKKQRSTETTAYRL